MHRRLLILMVTLGLTACGGSPPMLTGTWSGTVQRTNPISVSLTLVETEHAVTGSGQLASAFLSVAVSVRGSHTFPQVSLTLSSTGYYDIAYAATLSADGRTLEGTLTGSGFAGDRLALMRTGPAKSLVAP